MVVMTFFALTIGTDVASDLKSSAAMLVHSTTETVNRRHVVDTVKEPAFDPHRLAADPSQRF